MDAVEADGTIYIMTERVKPLSAELSSLAATSVKDKQDWILWGLHRITVRCPFGWGGIRAVGVTLQFAAALLVLHANPRSLSYHLECPFLRSHLMQRCSRYCSHRLDIYLFHWRMETRRV